MLERLDKLDGFRFKHHENYNLPLAKIRSIEDFIQRRISEIRNFRDKEDDLLKIAKSNVVVKGKTKESAP